MKSNWRTYLLYSGGILLLAGCIYIIFETIKANNTGFETKTLWDWMELLIVPIVLATGAFYLNRSEKKLEREVLEARAKLEREIAIDRQQEAAFQAYLDKISELLLKDKLLTTRKREVRDVARTRTLSIIRTLDTNRSNLVIQFLREARLIVGKNSIFRNANMKDMNLQNLRLQNIDLQRADLTGANLEGAILTDSNMEAVIISNANLKRTILDGANLKNAYIGNTTLKDARLSDANLNGAMIIISSFESARLWSTKLQNTDIVNSTFKNATLSGANLKGARLRDTTLENARKLEEAILPNGRKFNKSEDNK